MASNVLEYIYMFLFLYFFVYCTMLGVIDQF
jgi:hypothetical protein